MRVPLVLVCFLVACSDRVAETELAITGDPHDAINVAYDPTTSELAAHDVQQALDLLAVRPFNVPGPEGLVGQAGAAGPSGIDGEPGANGSDGISATSQVLAVADLVCAFGGTRFDAASGTSYACNGVPGSSGEAGPQGSEGPQGPQGDF